MSKDTSKSITGPTRKVVKPVKTDVTTNMVVSLVTNKSLGEYLRLFVGSVNGACRREGILHHPVGKTELDDGDWVYSEVGDIQYMLSRLSDPDEEKVRAARTEKAYQALVHDGLLLKEADGQYGYPNEKKGETRKDLIKAVRDLIKDRAGKNEKLNFDQALARLDLEGKEREIEVRKKFAELVKKEEEGNPSNFLTMGGSRADVPQVALSWAKSLTIAQVADALVKQAIEYPVNPALIGAEKADEELPGKGKTPRKVTGYSKSNWITFPKGWDKTHSVVAKNLLDNIKKDLVGDGNKDIHITITEVNTTG